MGRKADPYLRLTAEEREEIRRRVLTGLLRDIQSGQRVKGITDPSPGGVGGKGNRHLFSGVSIETEILFTLPPEFTFAYEELFERALKVDGSSALGAGQKRVGENGELMKASGLGPENRVASSGGITKAGRAKGVGRGDKGSHDRHLMAAPGAKKHKTYATILSNEAFEKKQYVDAELVRLAELMRGEKGFKKGRHTCGAWYSVGDRYCSHCGVAIGFNR